MGRKATGRNSKMVRVPLDFDHKHGIKLYYEVLPVLIAWREESFSDKKLSAVRYEKMRQMFEDMDLSSWEIHADGSVE
jgi:hypothetical protein